MLWHQRALGSAPCRLLVSWNTWWVFVGVDRIRVVRELTEAWESAAGEDRVGLVVVEGPTGIGKTAVVQALYEQLAMRQAWPALLAGRF